MDIFGKRKISELEKELLKSKERLEQYKDMSDDLNNEIKRLTDELNAKITDCNVGSWCNECKYSSTATVYMKNKKDDNFIMRRTWFQSICDEDNNYTTIRYCSKRLREICSEFKKIK